MKYIKTYENNKLKNFIIWRIPNHGTITLLVIVEVLVQYDKDAKIVIRSVYDIENDFFTMEKNKPYIKDYWVIEKDIIYQSDTLQDCKNTIPILNDLNKYNI